jgi:hypothetical protein
MRSDIARRVGVAGCARNQDSIPVSRKAGRYEFLTAAMQIKRNYPGATGTTKASHTV